MPVKVVDASALGALAFGEPDAEAVAGALEDATLVSPPLLWFEMASICRKKITAYPEARKKIISVFGWTQRLPIRISAVDHEKTIWLAEETKLTTYDASYLWLASNLQGELVTLDRKLKKAAASILG
jgi:predicted nucleic acid-binding protein